MNRFAPGLLITASLFALASCTVGPKYSKPSVPMTPAFKEPPPANFKESGNWKSAQPEDSVLRGKWWQIFNDPRLNELRSNLTLRTSI